MHKLFGKNAEILYICLKYFVVRWFKIILLLLVLLASGYTAVMYYFFEEKNSFVVEKEIEFPLDKVFPQFDDLQDGMIIFCLIKIIAIVIFCRTKEREVP